MLIEIKGDITDTDCTVIAHGVNCQGVMGSGVAKALYEKWPAVKERYLDVFTNVNAGVDGENLLGYMDDAEVEKGKFVINCFTQQYYGYDGKKYLSYDALEEAMTTLHLCCKSLYKVDEIAIPKIGCGLAGGDWQIVKAILNKVFPEDFKVKVYSL